MNRHNRTYGDIPCTNAGDVDEPLQGYAQRKAVDECWCGNRKHIKWIVCSVCQTVVEDAHG